MNTRRLLIPLFACLFATTAWANVIIDVTNFPDENFRKWVWSQSYGSDYVLTDAEIADVTVISVSDLQIQDLKGIEFFTALTELECNTNQLTTLDVSKNTALNVLKCNSNQLTALDVTKNTALTELSCDWNQLTALDVSENTALESLMCSGNQLTTLDVSKNTALKTLTCSRCKLTALDVTKNTALTELNCNGNQLTTLDVSQNTLLTSLQCGGNQLTSLDVTLNTALTELSCNTNGLTTLDVSKNTALTNLYCSMNQLTALDLSKNTSLSNLYFNMNQIKGSAMDALIESLPNGDNNMMFVIWNVSEGNVMTSIQVAAAKAKGWIPYYFDGEKRLEYAGSDLISSDVAINETNFPDEIFRNWVLSQTYGLDGILTDSEVANMWYLNVENMQIQSLKGIEFFTALSWLQCDGNQLTALDVSKNTELSTLQCYSNQLTSLDVSKNTALTNLNCSNNQLTVLDVSKNIALTDLWCPGNQLTSLDVSKNTMLTAMSCALNPLTSLKLANNSRLSSLYCVQCQIRGAAMDALIESLPNGDNNMMFVIWNENEGNVMTTTQVAAAKAKGWIPYYFDGENRLEYAGSDPNSIKAVVRAGMDREIYNLSGQCIAHPRKGLYITGGRKVVLK